MKDLPTYVQQIMRAFESGDIRQGAVQVAEVAHDDDCKIWSTGECTCDPDITISDSDNEER